jgi:hypothetical protein
MMWEEFEGKWVINKNRQRPEPGNVYYLIHFNNINPRNGYPMFEMVVIHNRKKLPGMYFHTSSFEPWVKHEDYVPTERDIHLAVETIFRTGY